MKEFDKKKPHLVSSDEVKDPKKMESFLSEIKQSSDDYVEKIEKKFGKPYEEVLKEYGIKKYRNHKNQVYIDNKMYIYNIKYPDKDKLSPNRTLSNEWGYFMVFKSIDQRTKDFLRDYVKKNNVSAGDTIINNESFEIEIKILGIR
tara:strand:+ start:152 stop:589 length:438 start_codon:yes stop_codon:yes gene_type:complete